jgi:two-component system nitrogen regulation response regulator GlnG
VSPSASKILIVDGQEEICAVLSQFMQDEGLTTVVAHSGEAALQKIRSEQPDVLVVELRPPDIDGMKIMQGARALDEDLPVILITGYPEIRGAVAAMRAGAHDYLAKPLKHHEVVRVIFRALNERTLKRKLRRLSGQIQDESSLREAMGPSDAVGRLIADVVRVAKTDFSVFILGETGSGKELVAHAIHRLSPRVAAPFMAVDCGAIPETLLESELFGHEKGAYTGADKQRIGKFENARGGTLFLDEISNMPLGSQAKLLRVLQEKAIYRLGGTERVRVDVRLVAASNHDLQRLEQSDSLRRDVYFRLNEFTISVPPLRERPEDILYLAKRFVDLTNFELQKNVKGFTQSAVEVMLAYNWPGNVRQLHSMIRRAVLLADDMITEQCLGIEQASHMPVLSCLEGDQETHDCSPADLPLKELKKRRIVALEREIIVRVLRVTAGNKAAAARLLHLDYKTIHSKIRQYGISVGRKDQGAHGREEKTQQFALWY